MTTKGSEVSAIQVLTRAVQLDGEMKFNEAVTCYEQGIRLLLQAMKDVNEEKKNHYKKKVEEYLSRAETLKNLALKEKEAVKNHQQIQIKNNETGFGYERIFGSVVDEVVTSVEVEDAYIRANHQLKNFVRFCEFLVKKAKNLKNISLYTTSCMENTRLQQESLDEISRSLMSFNIKLDVHFSETLHDREIRFNTGWIVKIGRGLDLYKKPPPGRFIIGFYDLDLRPCHETTIDIFHRKAVKSE